MNPWRPAAAIGVGTVGALVGGATIRLLAAANRPAAVFAVAVIGTAVIGLLAVGSRARPLSTAYW